MNQSVHFITLSTLDLNAARDFYVSGLGWTPLMDVPGEIVFFQIAPGTVLGLFEAGRFAADMEGGPEDARLGGVTLAHNVASPQEVDAVVDQALKAGARLVKSPARADFGGYHGHIADPNGVVWEVCHNPGWSVDEDGTVRLGPVEG
ncbi:VOC family protein [Nocardiopsis suaedae]|uniref:VOC family protein n=1 Tax=Nocardiopsis suaedae TaxID=3018444 RepID=A0ABT4TH05_9ACTN|nr:VOC family protein [Nocardiopsis suaedae]MDA2803995.1 VOC family protein [Nocardiopsis suaedae]